MEKKRIKDMLLSGALALGLSVTAEDGHNQDEVKNMPPEKPAEKLVIKQVNEPEVKFDYPTGREEVSANTAPPEIEQEDQESLNKYSDYDPRVMRAIEKAFPGTKIDLDDDDIFRRIRVGDYFLDRNVSAEESYSLRKWIGDNLNYEQDNPQFRDIKNIIKIINKPDGLFILKIYGNDLQIDVDEAHLSGAMLEYVKLKENLIDSQYDLYIKSGGNYVESVRLKNYYEARLRQLKELKTQKWNFIPIEGGYQNIIDNAIKDTLIYLKNIEEDIAKIQL